MLDEILTPDQMARIAAARRAADARLVQTMVDNWDRRSTQRPEFHGTGAWEFDLDSAILAPALSLEVTA